LSSDKNPPAGSLSCEVVELVASCFALFSVETDANVKERVAIAVKPMRMNSLVFISFSFNLMEDKSEKKFMA
jgi:hypothetical protein